MSVCSGICFVTGVKILEGVQVEKVLTKNKSPQVSGVETSHGTIQCEYFVNCAGQVNKYFQNYLVFKL